MFYNTVVLVISTIIKMVQMEYYTHNGGETHINHNETDISLNSLDRKFIYVFQETVPHCGGVGHWKQSPHAKAALLVHIPGANVSC